MDPSGRSGITIGIMAVGGLIGAAISTVSFIVTQQMMAGTINWKFVGIAAATGFISGLVATSPLGLLGQ